MSTTVTFAALLVFAIAVLLAAAYAGQELAGGLEHLVTVTR